MLANPDTRLFVQRIAEHWAESNEAPSQPEGTRWRGSWAARCARWVAYNCADEEPSNPPTVSAIWRMGLGSVVHELLEPAVQAWLKNDDSVQIQEEMTVELGKYGHGHIDLVLETDDGKKIVLELKTINGFGYKMAIEQGQGPRHNALVQGSMYAHAIDADLLVLGYLSLENISAGRASKFGIDDIGTFASEWHYTKEEFTPIAEAEIERLEGITSAIYDEGLTPLDIPRRFSHFDPDIPFPAEITAPSNGTWRDGTEFGKVWQCNYCDFQNRCVEDHAKEKAV